MISLVLVICFCILPQIYGHFPHTNTQMPSRNWMQSIVMTATCFFPQTSATLNYTQHTSPLQVSGQQCLNANLSSMFSISNLQLSTCVLYGEMHLTYVNIKLSFTHYFFEMVCNVAHVLNSFNLYFFNFFIFS